MCHCGTSLVPGNKIKKTFEDNSTGLGLPTISINKKKISEKFMDDNFISNNKNGYYI